MILPSARETCGRGPRRKNSRTAARAEKLACEIDVDHCIPLRERHFVKRRIPLQSGIRDDNVEGAEHGTGLLEHLSDLVLVRHISAMHDGSAAQTGDLMSDGMRLVVAGDVVHDDRGASFRHCDRDRLADAGIGAGDQRLLAGERLTPYTLVRHDLAFPDVHFPLPIYTRKR
jgi:hypothetical protein